ncbi:MAG TPA: hypothetical protein VIR01_11130 [Pyrinomonadaceae bacterium]|jgi:hypothetical protein
MLRKLFQISVTVLVIAFSLPFVLLAALLFVVLFTKSPTETSGITAGTGGLSLAAWFFVVLALPVLFAGIYLITRWARHRR